MLVSLGLRTGLNLIYISMFTGVFNIIYFTSNFSPLSKILLLFVGVVHNNCINRRWMVFGVKEEGITDQTMTIAAMWSQKEVRKVEREMLTGGRYVFGRLL